MVFRWWLAPGLLALAPLTGCNWVFGIDGGLPEEEAPPAASGPPVYLEVAEIGRTRARVDAGDEPWASAYPLFLQDVAVARGLTPRSVIDDGAGSTQTDERLFATDSLTSNCIDGLDNERHDYCAALLMGQAARDLALAWRFAGDDDDARLAIDFIQHFLLDETTGVRPTASNAGPRSDGGSAGSPIEIALYVPPFAYAASLLRDHPHWDDLAGGEQALETWFRAFRSDALAQAPAPSGGTRYAYHLNAVAAVDAYLDDAAALDATFAAWRELVDGLVDADGLLTSASSDDYFFWLEALTLTAQIASYRATDLFGHADANGVVLERVFEAHAPCLGAAGTCPRTAASGGALQEGASMYELGHSAYQSAAQLSALEAVGRPVRDIRILGWTTLTHGNAFDR
ncbi:MAG: alginate lyase family protein [Myxococcales bacterium]|nr:alginate lyase family protein [Myxococcales bacterium]